MEQKNEKQCHTHTYLTPAEENSLAQLILKEISNPFNRRTNTNLLPAPSELCDLIY